MTTKCLGNQAHRPKDTGEYERADITSFRPATLFLSPTPQSPLNLPQSLPSRINEDKEQGAQYDPLPMPGASLSLTQALPWPEREELLLKPHGPKGAPHSLHNARHGTLKACVSLKPCPPAIKDLSF